MQLISRFAAVVAAVTVPFAGAAQLKFLSQGKVDQSPVYKAIDLVADIEANLIGDGKVEQQDYDKYMCWCEDTLARKSMNINEGKDTLEKLGLLIPKTGAEVASHSAEIAQLNKDIKANQESQREATEMRGSENQAFQSSKAESENSIGALEAAVTAVTGAGTQKGFLETIKQAQLISVAAGVKQVLLRDPISKKASSDDMETLRRFVEQPGDFLSNGASDQASALQVAGKNNPFGDYAPQSTQIQGILKGLYDGFVADMEKSHGSEADKQKAFEELMSTKARELSDLQGSLEQHTGDKALKAKLLADSNMERDDTREQVKADEAFYEETKDGCQSKSKEWSERTRLRTEELMGIGEALKILRDPENQAIFNSAATTLLQLDSTRTRATGSSMASAVAVQKQQQKSKALATVRLHRVYSKLSKLAAKLDSLSLARIAAKMSVGGGHFDQVMVSIDNRVVDLRKEEQEDIEHRDRCEASQAKNANDIEHITHKEGKAKDDIDRMANDIRELNRRANAAEGEMGLTDLELAELLKFRNDDVTSFKQAVKDDTMAVQILNKAISAMAKFYKKNLEAMSLLQVDPKEYTIDQDKAPETSYDSSKTYGGRKSQSSGAIGALEMVVSDIRNEIEVTKRDDAKGQAQYEEAKADLLEVREKAERVKTTAENRAAELNEKKEDLTEHKASLGEELSSEKQLKSTITSDCAWVATHFDQRRTKRKAEIDGLQEAKSLLAGAETGDFDELSVDAAAAFVP